jgi:hypothetical protein
VDSSGIKVSNRDEWMHKKWRMQRGFIKVHIAVDTKIKQILAIEVTKEDVGDCRMFGRLVSGSSGVANVKKVIVMVFMTLKANFRLVSEMDIEQPLIKVRKNASLKADGCMPRKFVVMEQLGNEGLRCEKGHAYHWMVELAFSCFKRTFGEFICVVSGQI